MPAQTRKLKLGAFMFVPGNHIAGWRHPDAVPGGEADFAHYLEIARIAERGKMDAVFFQDTVAVIGSDAIARGDRTRENYSRIVNLDPVALTGALAASTSHIGLVATATTTYYEPYVVARQFASLDHISGGRAGWNLVTSQVEDEAGNFGRDEHLAHGNRYDRATEFYEVVAGLWDSWEEDAFPHSKETGIYFDRAKLHFLNHKGAHFSVRGPLNVARTPQGRPVVSQAGSSEAGKELAAKTADLVFTAQVTLEDAKAFYDDLKSRLPRHGRRPDDLKIMPGLMPIVAETDAAAQEKFESLHARLSMDLAVQFISRLTPGIDLTKYDLDGPLPPLPESNAAKGRQKLLVDLAARGSLSIRQVASHMVSAGGHPLVIGSPKTIADHMQHWLEAGAVDGFNIMFPHYPKPVTEFVDLVIPELQRRGIFRTEYEGKTLRENLGVPVPPNRYAKK